MPSVCWAGLAYDPPDADDYWSQWWKRAERDIQQFLAEPHQHGLVLGSSLHIPEYGQVLCTYRTCVLSGLNRRQIVDVARMIDRQQIRIGFGLLALNEQDARALTHEADAFLKKIRIRHPRFSTGAWVCGIPLKLEFRKL